jgi:glycosyltransferase involved in cell wall biosynthesis
MNSDPRIKLLEQSNSGVVLALNRALIEAQGNYCARMDADDISLPERLQKQFNFLEKNTDVLAVGGQGYIIDEDGDLICPLPVLTDHDAIDVDLLNRFNSRAMIHPSVMFRTNKIRKIGGYRESYIWAEDLDLFLRVAEVGKLANLDSVVIHYRRHAKSISHTRSELQRASAIKAVNDARRRRGLPLVRYSGKSTKATSSTRLDYMYFTALSALSHGWKRTSLKYLQKMISGYGLTRQSIKLSLRIVAAVITKPYHTKKFPAID